MRRMGHQPGELNHYFYQPRGLVLALASSRRPLTSACTMAGAALAAGDPVVLKPGSRARESSAYLARLLVWAGFPADAVGFLPVSGDELGDELVSHPDVDVVAVHRHRVRSPCEWPPWPGAVSGATASSGSSPTSTGSRHGAPTPRISSQFLEPRVVTENTLRRGFVPSDDLLEVAR